MIKAEMWVRCDPRLYRKYSLSFTSCERYICTLEQVPIRAYFDKLDDSIPYYRNSRGTGKSALEAFIKAKEELEK